MSEMVACGSTAEFGSSWIAHAWYWECACGERWARRFSDSDDARAAWGAHLERAHPMTVGRAGLEPATDRL